MQSDLWRMQEFRALWVPGVILYVLGVSDCMPLGSLVVVMVMVEEGIEGAENRLFLIRCTSFRISKIGSRSTSTHRRLRRKRDERG